MSTLFCRVKDLFRGMGARRADTAPPVSKSLIYALCDEYRQPDLWTDYYAFRLDPRTDTWQRLRRRNVAWRREDTVETLLYRLCPLSGKRTPDPATVELALTTTSSFLVTRSKQSRADASHPARSGRVRKIVS